VLIIDTKTRIGQEKNKLMPEDSEQNLKEG
jgi:hypothetical protein